MHPDLDLAAYRARLGLDGALGRDLDSLRRLHRAHVGAIPFENIDVQAGRGVRIDLASVQAKLVTRRRGGYCFEQNMLFMHVLEAIGFVVMACEARVRPPGATEVLPRTHMVLLARLGRRDWLCDVGFGGDGLLEPIPLDGTIERQIDRDVRVAEEGNQYVLQSRRAHRWEDAYAFVPEPRYPIDFEVGNWYTSTHPSSIFRDRLTVQRTLPEARHVLRQLTYTVEREGGDEAREVPRAELPALLRDVFGLDVDDEHFPGLDDAGGP